MSKIKLKPCPFCGGEAEFKQGSIIRDEWFYVECRDCYAQTPGAGTKGKAAEKWNARRPEEQALEKLKSYELIEEKGLLFAIPCKIKDTVYRLYEGEVREGKVISISMLRSSVVNNITFHVQNRRGAVTSVELKEFGKTVFCTKEEAVKKIEETEIIEKENI